MRSRGFTLIEVLVALLIACVTMAAVARSATAVRAGERDSELLDTAARLAEAALEDRIARGALELREETASEMITDRLGRFERRVAVGRGVPDDLWHVEVTVLPPRGAAVSVHALLHRPWKEP